MLVSTAEIINSSENEMINCLHSSRHFSTLICRNYAVHNLFLELKCIIDANFKEVSILYSHLTKHHISSLKYQHP